jgi:hypothetical protein
MPFKEVPCWPIDAFYMSAVEQVGSREAAQDRLKARSEAPEFHFAQGELACVEGKCCSPSRQPRWCCSLASPI